MAGLGLPVREYACESWGQSREPALFRPCLAPRGAPDTALSGSPAAG